jgi:DNA-binding MarR family transcriptional regulator
MITQQKLDALRAARERGLGRMLLLARRNFVLRVMDIQKQAGIPPMPPAAFALLPFIDLDGTRSSTLADKAGISKQAAGKGIHMMESMGLVRRQADASDARAWRICFTAKGIDYMNRALKTIGLAERELAAQIGSEDYEVLKQLLHRLAYTADPRPKPVRSPRSAKPRRTRD